MGLIELKENLHQLIDQINNESVLEAHLALLTREAENKADWWDKLSLEEQEEIDEGLAQVKNGDTVPHAEVMKIFDKWK